MMLKLMFWAIWWLTLLVIEIRSKFEGQNKGGSMVGKDETLGNYHLLMDWWRRTTGVWGGRPVRNRQGIGEPSVTESREEKKMSRESFVKIRKLCVILVNIF